MRSLLLLTLLFLSVAQSTSQGGAKEDPFVVEGFVSPEGFPHVDLNTTALILTDLLLYSLDPIHMDDMFENCCLEAQHFKMARQARAYKRDETGNPLRLWLVVPFGSQWLDDEKTVDKRLQSLVQFARRHQLDGIDFCRQKDPLEVSFLDRAAAVFHRSGLLLSVTLQAGDTLQNYDKIDRIHVQAFGLPAFQYHAGATQTQFAVDRVGRSGAPARKVSVGIPLYTKDHDNRRVPIRDILYDPFQVQSSEPGVWQGLYYESAYLTRQKAEWSLREPFGGVFLWMLGDDRVTDDHPVGTILEAIAKTWQEVRGT